MWSEELVDMSAVDSAGTGKEETVHQYECPTFVPDAAPGEASWKRSACVWV